MLDTSATLDDNMANQGIILTAEDTKNLRTAGKWGQFVAIVGIVFLTLMVLIFIGVAITAGSMSNASPAGDMAYASGVLVGYFIFYAVILGGGIYLYALLYRFSKNAVRIAEVGDQRAVGPAFSALARLLTITGIMFIVYFCFAILAIGGGVIASIIAASSTL